MRLTGTSRPCIRHPHSRRSQARFGAQVLTAAWARRQLRFPVAVLAPLLTEQKASQSLPALQAPVSNRNSRSPRGGGPEVFFVVHVPVALPAFIAGRPLRRATAFDLPVGTRCRTVVPAIT